MTRREKLAAVAIGVLLAVAVSVAFIAYDQAHRTETARQADRADRVRSDTEIARIARAVFRQETKGQRKNRIGNAALEAIQACEPKPQCVDAGRRLFGPTRARMRAYARWAARERCTRDRCRGAQGPRGAKGRRGGAGRAGKDGRNGKNGRPGADGRPGQDGVSPSADDVIAELCRRADVLARLKCPRR